MIDNRSSRLAKENETVEIFMIDIDEMEWEISFTCPGCGNQIFPEDNMDFELLEVKLEDEAVREAVIRCKYCTCVVRLSGLGMLSRIGCFQE